jgi:hypothetical protein
MQDGIGGVEFEWHGPVTTGNLKNLISTALAQWPNGLVEITDREKEEGGPHRERLSFTEAVDYAWELPCELFLYKDDAAFNSWEEQGRTDDNADGMISVEARDHSLMFIFDDSEEYRSDLLVQAIQLFSGSLRVVNVREALKHHRPKPKFHVGGAMPILNPQRHVILIRTLSASGAKFTLHPESRQSSGRLKDVPDHVFIACTPEVDPKPLTSETSHAIITLMIGQRVDWIHVRFQDGATGDALLTQS